MNQDALVDVLRAVCAYQGLFQKQLLHNTNTTTNSTNSTTSTNSTNSTNSTADTVFANEHQTGEWAARLARHQVNMELIRNPTIGSITAAIVTESGEATRATFCQIVGNHHIFPLTPLRHALWQELCHPTTLQKCVQVLPNKTQVKVQARWIVFDLHNTAHTKNVTMLFPFSSLRTLAVQLEALHAHSSMPTELFELLCCHSLRKEVISGWCSSSGRSAKLDWYQLHVMVLGGFFTSNDKEEVFTKWREQNGCVHDYKINKTTLAAKCTRKMHGGRKVW